jgi:DNA polymerase-1
LGIKPEEQTALRQYLAAMGHSGKEWGAHISKAPGGIVGEYAKGDTFRTRQLYEHLLDHVNKQGMLDAYRREQRLAPILNANERDGIRVDLARLSDDSRIYEEAYQKATDMLCALLGDINVDSSAELAAALLSKGFCKEDDFKRTPTGKLSTAKESMDGAVKDPVLRQLLGYRSNMKTSLTTFIRPWLTMAEANNGRLHPQFNQVRGAEYGTRTGRMSSSNPNFQNIPTEFKFEAPAGLPPLPAMRRYVLPDEGHVLVSADFASQEFRGMAHFAEGKAAEIYRDDPKADFHAMVAKVLKEDAGMDLPRKQVKIVGFSLLYGAGLDKLGQSLGVDRATAQKIRNHYFQVLPGVKQLMEDVSSRGRAGSPVKTWGGRLIYAEPPKIVNGQRWDFSYKLVNYLIQGSAADQTKEAINVLGYKTAHRRFIASVHDEIVVSCDPNALAQTVKDLRHAMEEQQGWDVPFKITLEVGPNWWDGEAYETT